jgi:anti-sigma regulatory factor (Ser/Thr protein kinase)
LKELGMCADGTPASPYLAQWSWVVDGGPPDVAVVRDAARATADNWGLGALADDVALIVAEFSSNAWTYGDLPITVTLRLQEGVLTIEVNDMGPGLALFTGPRPLGAGSRGFPAAAAIAQEIGVDGRACETTVWARLHFRWVSAETEPGAVS